METEKREIRFGIIAVKKGFVTPEHIVSALGVQVSEDLTSGKHRPIGSILLEQELITTQQLEEVAELIEGHENKD